MSSSFFLKSGSKGTKKRKQSTQNQGKGRHRRNEPQSAPPQKKRAQPEDEEIASDDDDEESGIDAQKLTFSDEGEAEETPQDKRLRLAKQYLEEVGKQEAEKADDREVHDHVAQRLRSEYLDSVGKLRRHIAAAIQGYDAENIVTLKHKMHHLPLCSMVLSTDGKFLFAGAKSQIVLKWNVDTHRVEGSFNVKPHTEDPTNDKHRRSHVIAMCLSSDFKYLALAEGGNNIQIWCPQELKHLKTFKGHRDTVTALTFRRESHDLYSASRDRSVKIWSLNEMTYVESLFGHQTGITGIDALSRERAITSGGRDCSLRIWKIAEESQLIYNGHRGSIEAVKFLNDEFFVSSGDDGSLCLWSALKKKPIHTETLVHGKQSNGDANWITALACVVNTDLIASGSCDGHIRLWQSMDSTKKMKEILKIPMEGFINALVFNSDGSKLYAAVGQEHRLGRWWRVKEAKNKIVVIDLISNSTKDES